MKTGKYITILVIIALCAFPLSSRNIPEKISFAGLAANPEYYNEKYITIEGYFCLGFEILVIAERLEESPDIEGRMITAGIKIWLEGDILEEIIPKTGWYFFYYPIISLTGVLHYGGGYGHLNMYDYLLTIYDYTWLDYEPQKNIIIYS
jgi:hypothetical protein